MELDRRRIQDDTYRWEVVETLMREHAQAIAQYCTAWLGEGLAAEVRALVYFLLADVYTRRGMPASARQALASARAIAPFGSQGASP